MRLTAIDLFAGAGGLSLGLSRAGFDVIAAFDSWQLATETYNKNFPHAAVCADVTRLTAGRLAELTDTRPGQLDLLAGGPPCQGFSVQRIGEDRDERNRLVLDFARLVIGMRPRIFLMENVPGLLGKRGQAVVNDFARRLHRAGYEIAITQVNAADYGVPQNRRRVLVIGSRHPGSPPRIRAARHVRTVSVWSAIGDLSKPAGSHDRFPSDPLHVESRLSELNRERLRHIPPGGGFEDLPPRLRVNCHARGAAAIGHRGVYGRLHPDVPAGTITARFDSFTRGRFAHPFENRNLTLREGARLQTFPDDFTFVGNREEIAAQIGNAVPPRLAFAVGRQLVRHLEVP